MFMGLSDVALVSKDIGDSVEPEVKTPLSKGEVPFMIGQEVVGIPVEVFGITHIKDGTWETLEDVVNQRDSSGNYRLPVGVSFLSFPTFNDEGKLTPLELQRLQIVKDRYLALGFITPDDLQDQIYLDSFSATDNQFPMLLVEIQEGEYGRKIKPIASQRLVYPSTNPQFKIESIIPSTNGHEELNGKPKQGIIDYGKLPFTAYLDSELDLKILEFMSTYPPVFEISQAAALLTERNDGVKADDSGTLNVMMSLMIPLINYCSSEEGIQLLQRNGGGISLALAARTGIYGRLRSVIPERGDDQKTRIKKGGIFSRIMSSIGFDVDFNNFPLEVITLQIGTPAYDRASEMLAAKNNSHSYGIEQNQQGRVFPMLIILRLKPNI